ncbi:Hpt domain-containing protein [Massilia horti]|uniref:HPt domain-containing protein n=1 Tax=Massilia horti TaxID=2562153 RepID=A0A4Y9T3Q8_9BURK|nr:Hpt domain-containing protein [Massilia horti]TFW31575.1 hypothetical protein E4O92_13385 [Massilia horti]
MGRPIDQDFFSRLAELSERFAAEVPALLERLASASAAFDTAAPDLALAEEVQTLLHTMAGSAATFGFRVLGHQARLLEQRLRVLMAFDEVQEAHWNAWFADLDCLVAWGLIDPKATYYIDESEQ